MTSVFTVSNNFSSVIKKIHKPKINGISSRKEQAIEEEEEEKYLEIPIGDVSTHS